MLSRTAPDGRRRTGRQAALLPALLGRHGSLLQQRRRASDLGDEVSKAPPRLDEVHCRRRRSIMVGNGNAARNLHWRAGGRGRRGWTALVVAQLPRYTSPGRLVKERSEGEVCDGRRKKRRVVGPRPRLFWQECCCRSRAVLVVTRARREAVCLHTSAQRLTRNRACAIRSDAGQANPPSSLPLSFFSSFPPGEMVVVRLRMACGGVCQTRRRTPG